MPDFDFYREAFGGGVFASADGFLAVLGRAEAKVREYERVYTVCYPAADGRKKAVCAIAEEMELTRRATDEAEGRVTSLRVGDVSTGYAALSPAAFVQGAESRYYKAALVYADIYRGALARRLAWRSQTTEPTHEERRPRSGCARSKADCEAGGAAWGGALARSRARVDDDEA